MEFPTSARFDVTSDSTYDTAKAFLDNERGDSNETLSSKAEVKDFIAEQSGNDLNIISNNGDELLRNANVNGNVIEEKYAEGNKEHNDSLIKNDDESSEQEKFNTPSSDSNETCSKEDEKFKDNKNSNESAHKDFKANENLFDSNHREGYSKNSEGKNSTELQAVSDSKPGTSETKEEVECEKEEWMDILGSGQLKKKTLKQGIPNTRPQKADVCEINVIGKLEDGTVFEQHKCLEINLGDNETVQGLDFALALMDSGEEAEVIIASRFGYGSIGFKPLVPPDATLFYHITLLDVKPEPLISTVGINERLTVGRRKKERGNWWYARDEHTLAIHSYRRALDYLDDTDIPGEHTEQQIQLLIEERLKTYNNLGVSQMKISAYDAALISIDHVLNCQPKNVKALFRKSKILKEKGELSKSIEVIRQALAIEPDSKGFQQELSLLLAAQRKDNSKQRDLYKKMMGNSLQDSDSDKKKKPSSNAFKWIAAFSFAVAVIGAVAFKYRL